MAIGGMHASGATLRFADFVHPGVECELAVRLARRLPPGPCTAEQAEAAVGELFAAIEIVENRYGDLAGTGHADADRRPDVPRRGGDGFAGLGGLAWARCRGAAGPDHG